jgi:hypothetical protein
MAINMLIQYNKFLIKYLILFDLDEKINLNLFILPSQK